MSEITIDSIVTGGVDDTGSEIKTVYSKVRGSYAVYANAERIMVQFSENELLAKDQRKALSGIAPIRGEINGLIDGWRGNWFSAYQSKAKRYDRRTADALIVALQGDQQSAEALLTTIKADIIDERTSIGRSQYVGYATIVALLIFVLFWAITPAAVANDTSLFRTFAFTHNVWLATGVGSLGALFSIAIGIRSREIHTDLRRRDNLVDATLRIAIGAISAFVLFSLLKSKLVNLTIGTTPLLLESSATSAFPTNIGIVVAFLAGFSERLVGNFLSGAVLTGASPQAPLAAPTSTTRQATAEESGRNESNPLGTPPRAMPAVDPEDDHDHPDQLADHCLCDTVVADEDITDDANLPPAEGGIETRQN